MTTAVVFINSNADLFSAADIFLKNNFRRLPVLDGDQLIGQISRRDLLRAIKDFTSYDFNNDAK